MLKPLKVFVGVLLLVLFVGPVSQMLSEAEAFAQTADTAWVRRYNGPESSLDYGMALAVDVSGYIYVTGYSQGTGTSNDYATIKYYSNGDTAWLRRYDGPGNLWDEVKAMVVDDSGHVYVTGGSYGIGTSYDYATIRYFSNGDIAWVERYNGPGNSDDMAFAITVDDSNCVYVTGTSKGIGTQTDYCTIKYHPDGDTVWVRRYNGPGNASDAASAMAVDDSGYVYVTGKSRGSVTWDDYATIKYHPNGDTAWVRRYNGSGNVSDQAGAIAIDGFGNVYVTGYSTGSETGQDWATIKYYPNGDTAWIRRYDGPSHLQDYGRALALDPAGNVYVTGWSYDDASGFDYLIIKYDPLGNEVWVEKYDGPANDYDNARDIAVDGDGNIYVTGESNFSGSDWDFVTIKYVQSNDVKDETGSREGPSEFVLSQNYPNPFNPTTKISSPWPSRALSPCRYMTSWEERCEP
ncbi:MAG: SBBP repeat-containing protein [Candidatus Zixiibacteriota bacterium]